MMLKVGLLLRQESDQAINKSIRHNFGTVAVLHVLS